MIPVAFDEENAVLDSPPQIADICEPLSVWVGQSQTGIPLVISCWKVTLEEIIEIQRTGRIWLTVMGAGMPPVQVSGTKPFEETT